MSIALALLDVLLPDPCPGCGGLRGQQPGRVLCAACAPDPPPLPRWVDPPAPVAAAWALGPYDGVFGALVRRGRPPRPGLHRGPGPLDGPGRPGSAAPVDAVCPVPVPTIRRMRRGFDQAELLARAVAAALQRPMVQPLRRVRQAEQAGRDGWARRHQANQAFLAEGDLTGHILLIDDVITTGATAAACASELLGCGARRGYLFCAVQAGAGDAATPYAEAPDRP